MTRQYTTANTRLPFLVLQSLVLENFTYFTTNQLRRTKILAGRETILFEDIHTQFFKYYFKSSSVQEIHLHNTRNGYEKLLSMKLGRLGLVHSPLPLQKKIIDRFFYHGQVPQSYLTELYAIVSKEGPKGTDVLNEFTELPEGISPIIEHNDTCPICMSQQEKQNLRHLLCGHVFCRDCLYELVCACTTDGCPLCRRVLQYERGGALLCWPLVPLDPASSRWKLFHGVALLDTNASGEKTVNNQTYEEMLKFHASYGRKNNRIIAVGHFSHPYPQGVVRTPGALRDFLAGTEKFVFLDTSNKAVLHYLEDLHLLGVAELWFMNLEMNNGHNRTLLGCTQGKIVRFFCSEQSLMFEKLKSMYQQLTELDYKLIFNKFTDQKMLLMYMAAHTLCNQEVRTQIQSSQVSLFEDSCVPRYLRWERKLEGYILNHKYYFKLEDMTYLNLIHNTVHDIMECVNLGN
jgi:hypothetical protein